MDDRYCQMVGETDNIYTEAEIALQSGQDINSKISQN